MGRGGLMVLTQICVDIVLDESSSFFMTLNITRGSSQKPLTRPYKVAWYKHPLVGHDVTGV
jgi:hypothetical protein